MIKSIVSALLAACAVVSIGFHADGAQTSSWAIDPARTQIAFTIDAVGFPRTQGQFRAFMGRLSIDFDHPALSRVAFTVKSDSIDVGSNSFNGTLRGAAFLDSMRFPEISFESNAIQKLDDTHVRVTGDLAMLGVAKPLTVDVEVSRPAGGGRLGFVARAKIDRLAWGMNSGYPVISRDVDLQVASEAVAK